MRKITDYQIAKWKHQGKITAFIAAIKALRSEVERQKEDLLEFGRHTAGCSAALGEQYRCRCGWREYEKTLKEGG